MKCAKTKNYRYVKSTPRYKKLGIMRLAEIMFNDEMFDGYAGLYNFPFYDRELVAICKLTITGECLFTIWIASLA